MAGLAAAACRNHPDREAIGICVKCRSRVCSECVTKVDGINYCVACLAALADRGARQQQAEKRPTSRWLAHLAALTLLGTATLLTWGLLEVALPGGG
jgi:hypothetical protein